MIRRFLIATALLVSSGAVATSWYYNQNGGFGIYQPLGWSIVEDGRSARLIGPINDSDQTEIFIASDWNSKIKTIEDLKRYLEKENPSKNIESIRLSDLSGFRIGNDFEGEFYILREPGNFIVVEYEIRGSEDQRDEGKTALSSIEIRTGGIEYP